MFNIDGNSVECVISCEGKSVSLYLMSAIEYLE
jgi:hypothetical protein